MPYLTILQCIATVWHGRKHESLQAHSPKACVQHMTRRSNILVNVGKHVAPVSIDRYNCPRPRLKTSGLRSTTCWRPCCFMSAGWGLALKPRASGLILRFQRLSLAQSAQSTTVELLTQESGQNLTSFSRENQHLAAPGKSERRLKRM